MKEVQLAIIVWKTNTLVNALAAQSLVELLMLN